jgi:hypothetical protein
MMLERGNPAETARTSNYVDAVFSMTAAVAAGGLVTRDTMTALPRTRVAYRCSGK